MDLSPETKEQSRQEDLRRLVAGEVTPEALSVENSFIPAAVIRSARIKRIGGKPWRSARRPT